MPTRELEPLYGKNHFRVLIGTQEFGFSEVSGLTSETDPEASRGKAAHRFGTVVLRRAITRSRDLYEWRRRIIEGHDDRRPVTIQQLVGAGGSVANSWRLQRAWPRRWSGPTFNAMGNDVAMEELELAFDDLLWLDDSAPRRRSRKLTRQGG
jgi:phage tail-like protein